MKMPFRQIIHSLKSGQSRKRTFLLGSSSSYATLLFSVIVGLISVPVGLHYFGPIIYGVWLVISSFLAYLGTCDFGISLSTLTFIAQTSDESQHRVILRRSIGILIVTAVIFVGAVLGLSHLFPGWVGILGKIPSNLHEEAAQATLAIGILTIAALPTTVFASSFSGLQEIHWNKMYATLRGVVTLGALLATVWVNGSLVSLAVFTGLGNILVGVVSGVHLLLAHPGIRPRLREQVTGAPSTRSLFSSGVCFLALQIAVIIIWNTDNIIISQFLGAEAVSPYGVTFKLFQMGISVLVVITSVLWPMYGEGSGVGDWDWIKRIYNHGLLALASLGGLIWVGGILFAQNIINIWAGPTAYGGFLVVFALGGYAYTSSFANSASSLLNSLNPTKLQVICGGVEAALNLGISLALVRPLGIGGVALGTFVASLATSCWFLPLYVRRRTEGKVETKIQPVVSHAIKALFPCLALALLAVLYSPEVWVQLIAGIAIVALYLILSWRVMPSSSRELIGGVLKTMWTLAFSRKLATKTSSSQKSAEDPKEGHDKR